MQKDSGKGYAPDRDVSTRLIQEDLQEQTFDRLRLFVHFSELDWIFRIWLRVACSRQRLTELHRGNFIFDQMWSEETRTGVLGLYTFYENDLIDIEFFPIKIFDYGQAVILENSEKQLIIQKLKSESIILQNKR